MTGKLSPFRSHGCSFVALLLLTSLLPARAQDTSHSQDNSRKLLKRVEPEYPSLLKRRSIGGTVRLKVHVKADGSVRDSTVLGGNPSLADAAQKAVSQWRFSPAPAETTMEVSMVFDPNS